MIARTPPAVRILACLLIVAAAPPASATPAAFDLQAHRGGRGEVTEESLAAFAHALEVGVSTLELDVVLTRDAQPVVWHDLVIESSKCADTGPVFDGDPRYPYVGQRVDELSLAQVRTLDCGLPQPQFPHARVVSGNVIATLPEVFDLVGHTSVRYNIETKLDTQSSPRRIVEVILAAVRAAGKVDAVDIESFDARTLALVRAAEPGIPLALLWEQQGDPLDAALAAHAAIISPEYTMVDQSFVDRAHGLGLKVIPWTVNDADTMRGQIADGVDGLITDYPSRLREVMAELGMLPARR